MFEELHPTADRDASRSEVPGARDVPLAPEVTSRDAVERERRIEGRLREWWLAERPGWVDADWYDAPIRPEVRRLLSLPPGPELIEALVRVGARPCPVQHPGWSPLGSPEAGSVPGFPCPCQIVVATAWDAVTAWSAVRSAEALCAAAGREPVTAVTREGLAGTRDPAAEELAPGLRLSPAATLNRIRAARELLAHPPLAAAVEAGALTAWTARCAAAEVDALTPDTARAVIDAVLAKLAQRSASGRRPWTSGEVRRAARAARLRIAGEQEHQLRARAWRDRRVQVFPDADGMALLHARLSDTDAHRIHRRLCAIAAGIDDPERTRDQVRADSLVDLLLGGPLPTGSDRGLPDQGLPDRTPPSGTTSGRTSSPSSGPVLLPDARAEVAVVVTLEALLGCSDEPAEIPGLGLVPAALARELAADGRWRAWVRDAASDTVTHTGSTAYAPSAGLARLIRAREPYCRMPGCRTPATYCDLDHTIPWPRGRTVPGNLGPLCRRHHNLKTHHGFELDPTDQGWRWRMPSGITRSDRPDFDIGG